ncbi:complex I subunit 5 family protein [Histidinibacterium lentulum]|uniref:NADH/ubiquinone/plastoquinone (Complex I) n=1 Tax=Histidinibacterium lentulum TaxID=2480588 RepID=A0A3N2QYD4_9RHOB|nr:proton-conducting transporter membrane subunit [Histidinibacterium lentulum]ROU00153.1 NADH/ubiquinone/plastoquinone (complex I) [Histidinibacterium lentulum]
MTLIAGPLLPLAALVWPLLLAGLSVLPAVRHNAIRLLPLAPLPGLWLALSGVDGVTSAPDLLLGVTLALEPGGRILLGMTAVLWCIAGLAAQPMARRPNAALFAGFWCLTLAGNLGVFLARDVATFYVAFAAVSLTSWFLIVHDRTAEAFRAGRVYIVIAILGEVALLLGLILGAQAAGSLAIAEVAAAIETPAMGLLVAGFGIKAGLVPLHVWLPLAHPAAPVPGSAVLSGAIVKAGLIGLLLFLPPVSALGPILTGLGLAGAFGAAVWGLTQANPKAVLAYSTVSQMGLMVMLVAAGGATREAVPYFAMHHGLAKGALFLLVGVALISRTRWQRALCLVLGTVTAASVAGAPLTGGALSKAAVKQGLEPWASHLLSLSSVFTGLLLAWFMFRLARLEPSGTGPGWTARFLLPALLAALALLAPWALWQDWTGLEQGYPAKADSLRDAFWPVAVVVVLAPFLARWPMPTQPPGDVLSALVRLGRRIASARPRPPGKIAPQFRLPARQIAPSALEAAFGRWSNAGTVLLLLIPLILVLLLV